MHYDRFNIESYRNFGKNERRKAVKIHKIR